MIQTEGEVYDNAKDQMDEAHEEALFDKISHIHVFKQMAAMDGDPTTIKKEQFIEYMTSLNLPECVLERLWWDLNTAVTLSITW